MDEIDMMFPIKVGGVPTYRLYQKEKIEEILESFESGHRFVGVEGPVGCGKSVMNYTAAMCIGGGATYITSTKVLQDQLGKEQWEDLRVLKGKRSYLCNNHLGRNIYCYDDSGEYITCENYTQGHVRKSDPITSSEVADAMEPVWGGNKFRSCFVNSLDFISSMGLLVEAVISRCKKETGFSIEDRTIVLECENMDDISKSEMVILAEKYILNSITCKLTNRECYHKSSRLLTMLSGVKVVNPEVMYYYNRFMGKRSPFFKNELLIIDECHGFDSAIQRIFSCKLPLTILKKMFGIDLYDVYQEKDRIEMLKKCDRRYQMEIKPLLGSLAFIKKMLVCLMVHNENTMALIDSESEVFETFILLFKRKYENGKSVRFFDILRNDPFDSNNIRFEDFMDKKFGLRFDSTSISVINHVEKFIDDKMGKLRHDATLEYCSRHLVQYTNEDDDISADWVIASRLMDLHSVLSDFFDIFEELDPNRRWFLLLSKAMSTEEAVKETVYGDVSFKEEKMDVLSLIVVNTGKVMNQYFYSHAAKVLMTSGTWLFPETQKRKLGVAGLELIKVPSTFDRYYRPTYVLENLFDFSLKEKYVNGLPVYFYKEHPEVYVNIIEAMVSKINDLFEKMNVFGRGCSNPNILIHSFTHNITRDIAANLHNVDNYWIDLRSPVTNKFSNKKVEPVGKDFILSEIDKNLDSGIVMISPSMNEGVDFKHRRARVQIILKHPIPNVYENPYIDMMANGDDDFGIVADPKFIDHLVFTTLCQQYGRIMRSEDDWGLTFIFDTATVRSLNQYVASGSKVEMMNSKFFFESIKGEIPYKNKFEYKQIFRLEGIRHDFQKDRGSPDDFHCR